MFTDMNCMTRHISYLDYAGDLSNLSFSETKPKIPKHQS